MSQIMYRWTPCIYAFVFNVSWDTLCLYFCFQKLFSFFCGFSAKLRINGKNNKNKPLKNDIIFLIFIQINVLKVPANLEARIGHFEGLMAPPWPSCKSGIVNFALRVSYSPFKSWSSSQYLWIIWNAASYFLYIGTIAEKISSQNFCIVILGIKH